MHRSLIYQVLKVEIDYEKVFVHVCVRRERDREIERRERGGRALKSGGKAEEAGLGRLESDYHVREVKLSQGKFIWSDVIHEKCVL